MVKRTKIETNPKIGKKHILAQARPYIEALAGLEYVSKIDPSYEFTSHGPYGIEPHIYDEQRRTLEVQIKVNGGTQNFWVHVEPQNLERLKEYIKEIDEKF